SGSSQEDRREASFLRAEERQGSGRCLRGLLSRSRRTLAGDHRSSQKEEMRSHCDGIARAQRPRRPGARQPDHEGVDTFQGAGSGTPVIMKFIGELTAHPLRRYPRMELADVYKLLHQAAMGSGHAIEDPAEARAKLEEELTHLGEGPDDPVADPISPDGKVA